MSWFVEQDDDSLEAYDGIDYPDDFGTIVLDFVDDEKVKPPSTKNGAGAAAGAAAGGAAESGGNKMELYVIHADSAQGNWNVPPKVYGLFWSDVGPDPVNKIAVEKLWPYLVKNNDGMDSETNLDGKGTAEGECHDGFACFNYGSASLTVLVETVIVEDERLMGRLYDKGLLLEALELRGGLTVVSATAKKKKKLSKKVVIQRIKDILNNKPIPLDPNYVTKRKERKEEQSRDPEQNKKPKLDDGTK